MTTSNKQQATNTNKQTRTYKQTVTVSDENKLIKQQKDLFEGYLLKYKEWAKIPKCKVEPSYKLLRVDVELGVEGIARKLGMDPSPIPDETNAYETNADETNGN